jgi:hypothetical protein
LLENLSIFIPSDKIIHCSKECPHLQCEKPDSAEKYYSCGLFIQSPIKYDYQEPNKLLRNTPCMNANIVEVEEEIKPNPFYQITGKEGQGV